MTWSRSLVLIVDVDEAEEERKRSSLRGCEKDGRIEWVALKQLSEGRDNKAELLSCADHNMKGNTEPQWRSDWIVGKVG